MYVPLSTPTNDYYGGYRPGDNLFAKSVVCLDARTGERVWHFQAVHGIWDYGPATAARAAEALARIDDPRRLTEAFDLITACDDADDLLSRLSGLSGGPETRTAS